VQLVRFVVDLDGYLAESVGVLAAVVGAKQEFAGIKNHAHERLWTAAVAAVCIGQWFRSHCTHTDI